MTSEGALPTGTVTFLLGDVEGSTKAWELDPAQMSDAMTQLRELVREVVATHGGVQPLEQGEGDSFVAAFAKATNAAAAALALSQRLRVEPLRIRLGLHTGEALLRDDGSYAGRSLNRAARLRDLGHGGQVLLTASTAELVTDGLPPGAELVDLGTHGLKDLARSERVFQLTHPDLPRELPPLRSLAPPPSNLPVQLTSFVGREVELAELRLLVAEHRLVSLVGPGGSGKTRLAVQLADHASDGFPDGVRFVDLAPLAEPDAVPTALAATLGLREGPRSPAEASAARLADKRCLVLFDNCEHVVAAAAALIDTLLRACPGLRVLATSRESLGLSGEVVWRAPPLARADAVALFLERARRTRGRAVTADDAEVGTICDRLEGMPLAIELAAARSGVLTPAQIAAGLDDCLRMLAGGPRRSLERHQTLTACLSWSHDLLSDAEHALLRRVAVFAGGFDLNGAQAVGAVEAGAALDLVASLVDKSWVVVDEHDGRASRYRLLEPVRQFAEARLVEAGEEEAARDRHVAHYTRLMRQAQPHLESGDIEWLARVDAEYDNICAALTRVTAGSDERAKVRLVAPLVFYWPMRSLHHDGMRWLDEALPATIDHPPARLTLLLGSAVLANQLTEQELARERASEALELAESLGDVRGIAWALQVVALVGRGDVGHATGGRVSFHSTEDRHLFERVLEYGIDVTGATVFYWAVAMLAWHLAQAGELASARHLVAAHLERCRKEAGPPRLAHMLLELGEIDLALGNLGGAAGPLAEAAGVAHQVGQPEMEMAILAAQAKLATARGEWAKGLELVETGGAVSGLRDVLGMSVDADYQRALILRHMGRVEDARAVLAVCIDALPRERVPLWTSEHDVLLGDLLRLTGEVASARAAVEAGIERQRAYGWRLVAAQGTVALARVAREEGNLLEAYALAHEALDVFAGAGAMLDLVTCLEVLAGVVGALDRSAEAVRLLAAGEAARERIDYVRAVVEQPSYDTDVAALRDALGAAAFDEAWHEGALLSVEEAVAYARRGRGERRRPASGWDSLTPTETEVVRHVADGLSNPEIAERMFVSRATVRTHLSHVFAKLGVSSRAELAAQAARRH